MRIQGTGEMVPLNESSTYTGFHLSRADCISVFQTLFNEIAKYCCEQVILIGVIYHLNWNFPKP